MKISILFGPLCLSFRGSFDFTNLYDDPRGMTGSEYGFVRIAEELKAAGHSVELHTVAAQTEYSGMPVRPLDAPIEADVLIAVNEPDLLRAAPAGAFRVCLFWLNDTSFCKVGFEQHVDLFLSPSASHLEQVFKRPDWRQVEKTPEFPNGKATYDPDPSKWVALRLGCDPERYGIDGWPSVSEELLDAIYEEESVSGAMLLGAKAGLSNDATQWIRDWHTLSGLPEDYEFERQNRARKVSGRVIYASSPDRGLHHLLSQWPAIRRAVPHATLHVFYRLEPWLRGFDNTPYFPAIEALRARANYVEECLARFKELGGMGVTLRDSVSRRTIEREMAQAEVLAFPCDTTTWSEGFSCTTLEACAARACPVITTCDALGEVYAAVDPVPRTPGWVETWRDRVIEALRSPERRAEVNEKAYALAAELTWKNYVRNLLKEIESRWPQASSSTPEPQKSNRSEPVAESS